MASVLQGTLFLIGLMSAAWTDLRRRQIYDLSGIIIAGAGLISFSPARLLGLALAVPFWLASRRGRGGMGDAFLIAASGFLLGFLRDVRVIGGFGVRPGISSVERPHWTQSTA